MIARQFGIKMESSQLILYLLQSLIEQKEGNIEVYDSKVTSDWIILSFVYFILSTKGDIYKQKPVLSTILRTYRSFPSDLILKK